MKSSLPCSPEKQHRDHVTTTIGITCFTAINTGNSENDNQSVYELEH